MPNPVSYERWMWIELLGFDIGIRDYGVSALCRRAGFVPQAVTLLLSDPDFVHGHTGDMDRAFVKGICSYDGHPYNEERQIQQWTARHLVGLIRALQRKGIEVYFSHFDAPITGWLKQHPELRFLNRHGEWIDFMSPYKRIADGQFYRDFYLPLLDRVMNDYGFDGYHAGDGFAHPRLAIYDGDFSDDSIAQYLAWSGDTLPKRFVSSADRSPALVRKRADWIWRERRLSWIEFHRERTTEFWKQAADLLKARQRKLIFNSCWTRDPFEALYRYGVDYAALHRVGVYAFLAETACSVHEHGGDLPYGEPGGEEWEPQGTMARFTMNLQLLRAAAPDAKIIFMNGIKDTNEAWSGIRHAPTNLESEILSHTGVFSVTGPKELKPSADGLLAVLSDSIKEHEWKWLMQRWDLGFSVQPTAPCGAAVYWSEHLPESLVHDYVGTRRTPISETLARLTLAGAPLPVTVRWEKLAFWSGPLVVIHPHLLSAEEWEEIHSRTRWPLITLGGPPPNGGRPDFHRRFGEGLDAFHLTVFHWKGTRPKTARFPKAEPFDHATAVDPFRWLAQLPAREIPDAVYQQAAEWIIAAAQGVRVLFNPADIRAWAYVTSVNTLRVHVRNESFYYRNCFIELPRKCLTVKTLTAFPGSPIVPDGKKLKFKVAGKSMAIFEVTTEK